MKKQFLVSIKTKLTGEAEELRQRLDSLSSGGSRTGGLHARFPQFGAKDDENAAEVASFGDAVGLTRDLEHSLADVETALRKIEDGSYGHCDRCGRRIEDARLAAMPAAARCVTCTASA